MAELWGGLKDRLRKFGWASTGVRGGLDHARNSGSDIRCDGDRHPTLPERLANGVSAYAVNLEMAKVWLFHDRAFETFSIRRNQ